MPRRAVLARIDLNLLVVLEALQRFRSVSRAAESLGLSQPAMSSALKRLREGLGDPLFTRAAHGLRPTARAEELSGPLQAILDQIENDLLKPPDFDPTHSSRTFTINMIDLGELVFMPGVAAQLRAKAPNVHVRSVSLASAALTEALASGEVDLAAGHFPTLTDPSLLRQRLFSHGHVVLARRDHPSIRTGLTREQFLSADHAIVEPHSGIGAHFESALERQGLRRNIVVSVAHYLAVPAVIAGSDIIATVPYAAGMALAAMADLRVFSPPLRLRPADVHLIWHARARSDLGNKWLRGIIANRGGRGSG
jgi:DNA-binding transcriptional LysR family regulator